MGAVMTAAAGAISRASIRRSARRARSACSASSSWCATARQKEPLAPFNGTSPEMAALGKFFRQEGLYTFVRWNTFFTNPPLCITEAELREAFAIIDRGLEITDKAVA